MVTTQQEQDTRTAPKVEKQPKPKYVFITCIDCGKERIVATQDAFQVKRCVDCQKRHRKMMRKINRTTKVERLQKRIAELEEQNVELRGRYENAIEHVL